MLQLKTFRNVTAYRKVGGETDDGGTVILPDRTIYSVESFKKLDDQYTEVVFAEPLNGVKSWAVPSSFTRIYSTDVVLKVASDTLFKQQPRQSSELAKHEIVSVSEGDRFYLSSYLPAENNHYRVAIADDFLGPENRTTWYVFAPDVDIVGDLIQMTVDGETLLKPNVLQSGDQDDDAILVPLSPGDTLDLVAHKKADFSHVQIELARHLPSTKGQLTWYVFYPHVSIEGNEEGNQPKDNDRPVPSGPSIVVPTYGEVYLNQPVLEGGNFTWAEVTKNGGRIPVNKSVVGRVVAISHTMEEVRDRLGGRPITINSWYRDPVTNRRVGGSSRSRHISGDAVDFVVPDIHPYDVYDRLNGWWGSKGGLASATVFTHIDARGYRARWTYGFAWLVAAISVIQSIFSSTTFC